MKTYSAFNNDKDMKADLVNLAIKHEVADQYIAGTFGDSDAEVFQGCSVGCTINDFNNMHDLSIELGDHRALAENLGVPPFITILQDKLFEGLPTPQRYSFTPKLLTAINVGSDLTEVLPKCLKFVLEDLLDNLDEVESIGVREAVQGSLDVAANWVVIGVVDSDAARAASEAASYAASYAASEAASEAASAVARAASYAASEAAASEAASDAAYTRYADHFIHLIKECK